MTQKPLDLGVVIPISRPERELHIVEKWIQNAVEKNLQLVFVFDNIDSEKVSKFLDYISGLSPSRINVVSGRFGSPGKSRNEGMKYLKSEWVAFWDGDDEPNILEFHKMVEAANLNGFSIAMGSFQTVSLQTGEKALYPAITANQDARTTVIGNPGLWRFAFKRIQLKESMFQDLSMGEDVVFLALNVDNLGKVFCWNSCVYSYTINDSASLTSNQKNFKDGLKSAAFLRKAITTSSDPEFVYIVSMRLCLGAIRHGGLHVKIKGFAHLLHSWRAHPGVFWKNRRVILTKGR